LVTIQRTIIERIEGERRALEGNRQLMSIYAEKIHRVIARVWEQPSGGMQL